MICGLDGEEAKNSDYSHISCEIPINISLRVSSSAIPTAASIVCQLNPFDRPDRKRRPPSGRAVRESGGAMNDIRQRSRSQGSLRTPLLVDHRPPETEFPKDVKVPLLS